MNTLIGVFTKGNWLSSSTFPIRYAAVPRDVVPFFPMSMVFFPVMKLDKAEASLKVAISACLIAYSLAAAFCFLVILLKSLMSTLSTLMAFITFSISSSV
ncbi:hypothetical protein D3Z38_12700 [Clostridiales bacterium]|nr:hypothetical protein [Clostridiales bacterium]